MVSRWPKRTGILVDGSVAYCAGGMWAAEGVFVYALDVETGDVVWCNDTSGAMPLMGAHATFSLTGVNPQGNLLAAGNVLLVPTGRTGPAAYDRRTGKLLYHDPGHKNNGFGGSWLTIDGDRFHAFAKNFYSPLAMRVANLADGRFIPDARRTLPQHSKFYREKKYSLYDGKTSVVVHGGKVYARKSYGLIKAGNGLIVGDDGSVRAESVDAKELWRADLGGQARGLAVADGRLFVSTDRGEISCFGSVGSDGEPAFNFGPDRLRGEQPQPLPGSLGSRLNEQFESRGIDRGYALVLGDADGTVSTSIAAETHLRVINVLHNRHSVTLLRNQLLDTTRWYGSRIHVQFIETGSPLPFSPYFANAVIVSGQESPVPITELYRALRPCGGVMLFPEMNAVAARKLIAAAKIPSEEIVGDDRPLIVRGQLPESLDWDSTGQSDRRVKWPLRPIWFGGPGPARMQSRKYRSQTLAFANGCYFVMGEGHLLAVDAYNGTELWSKAIPALQAMNADGQHVYLTLPDACVVLDARNGKETRRYKGDAVEQVPERLRKWTRPIVDQAIVNAPRKHPLTDRSMPKVWLKAFGCSGLSCSATSVFTRSGSLGSYDFADDSGMRNFGGLRPSCGQSTIAALGLWIVNEGSSSCECSYSYQTSLAFAPGQRRLHEDWAVFYDWDVDSIVRGAAVNLGAPGDRRDDSRKLWVGFPRPYTNERFYPKRPGNRSWLNIPGVPQQKMPVALRVPLTIELFEGGGTYRVNADRVRINNTDRPWIYTTGCRGIRKATMKLDFQRRLATSKSVAPPKLDGHLNEAEWGAEPPVVLLDSKTKVFLRHDVNHLYVSSFRPPIIDRRGQAEKWQQRMTTRDSQVYRDDSWEIFLTDHQSRKVVHLAVSASGAQYDALSTNGRRETIRWNAEWRSVVAANEKGFATEIAVPWKLLAEAGLDKRRLAINF
ncbi:MAG: PQQ-binding-like beta-propeller repeat protein, partial [Planctomycetaceae bacterium]